MALFGGDESLNVVVRLQDEASKQLASLQGKLEGMQKSIEPAANASKKFALGLTAAASAAGGFAMLAIKAAADAEQTKVAFETMLGSAEKADEFIRDLVSFAAKTPFTLKGLEQSAKQLLAYGFAQNEVLPNLKALGDIAAGVGMDKLPQLTLAFGQVKAATRLTGMELRQFTEAGVPLLQALADQLGKTPAAIQEMVSAGQIGFPMVQKALQDMTGEGGKFADLMEKQSKTLGGMWSNLSDAWDVFLRGVGAQQIDWAKRLVDGLLHLVRDVLPLWIEQTKVIVSWLGEHKTILYAVAGAMAGALVPSILAVAGAFALMLINLSPFIVAGGAFAVLIKGIKDGNLMMIALSGTITGMFIPTIARAAAALWTTLVPAFFGAITAAGPLLLGGAIIAALVAGVVYVMKNWEQFEKDVRFVWTAIKDDVIHAIKLMFPWFDALISITNKVLGAMGTSLSEIGANIKSTANEIGSGISMSVEKAGQSMSMFGGVTGIAEKAMAEAKKQADALSAGLTSTGGAGAGAGDSLKKAATESVDAWKKVKDAVASVTKELEDMVAKREQLLTENVNSETEARNDVAQAYVDQEKKIADLSKETEAKRLEALTASSVQDGKRLQDELQNLQTKLAAEKASLEEHRNIESVYHNEINSIREWNSLTDLERTLRTINQKRTLANNEFQGKLTQLNAEVLAKQEQRDQLVALEKSLSEEAIKYSKQTTQSVGDNVDKLITKYNDMYTAAVRAFSVGSSGALNMTRLPGRASGGPVSSGQPYMVGERGPEVFVPTGSGKIIPNGGAGGIVVNVNYPQVRSDGDIEEIRRQLEDALRPVILNMKIAHS